MTEIHVECFYFDLGHEAARKRMLVPHGGAKKIARFALGELHYHICI